MIALMAVLITLIGLSAGFLLGTECSKVKYHKLFDDLSKDPLALDFSMKISRREFNTPEEVQRAADELYKRGKF